MKAVLLTADGSLREVAEREKMCRKGQVLIMKTRTIPQKGRTDLVSYLSQNLDELREKNSANKSRNPFPHQIEAFQALNNTFKIPSKNYAGGLLVLPTGAGKTFTAVNWLCRNVLSKKIKILWFAQSSV